MLIKAVNGLTLYNNVLLEIRNYLNDGIAKNIVIIYWDNNDNEGEINTQVTNVKYIGLSFRKLFVKDADNGLALHLAKFSQSGVDKLIDKEYGLENTSFFFDPTVEPSYIIFQKSGIIYAKNSRTGQIDFSGTNVATVISQVLNAININETIYLKFGLPPTTNTIIINKSVGILGDAIITQANNANLSTILQIDADNVYIEGITIDGNRQNNTSGNAILINGKNVTLFNVTVQNAYTGILQSYTAKNLKAIFVKVLNCYESGIALVNRTAGQVDSEALIAFCYINQTGNHGILASGVNKTTIMFNYCENIGVLRTDGFAHGIAVDGNSGNNPNSNHIIFGNKCYNARMKGIEIADSVNDVIIAFNDCENNNDDGIYFGGAITPSTNAVIAFNKCINNLAHGIEVNSPNNTNLTKEITITYNYCYQNNYHGIFLGWCQGVDLASNKCINNGNSTNPYDGIRLGESKDVDLIGNICYDNRTIPLQNYGIAIYPSAVNVRFFDNKIGTNKSGTISIVGGTNIQFRDNAGYVTRSKGQATIPANSTSVVVNHGLVQTPNIVLLTPTVNVKVWVTNVTSTSFTINIDTAQLSNTIVYWYAEV